MPSVRQAETGGADSTHGVGRCSWSLGRLTEAQSAGFQHAYIDFPREMWIQSHDPAYSLRRVYTHLREEIYRRLAPHVFRTIPTLSASLAQMA